MSVLTKVEHFMTTDKFSGISDAIQYAMNVGCYVYLSIGIGYGWVDLMIGPFDTYEDVNKKFIEKEEEIKEAYFTKNPSEVKYR